MGTVENRPACKELTCEVSMFLKDENSRTKTAYEKEWKYITKQEERLEKAAMRQSTVGPSVLVWKEKLEQKIPVKIYDNLRAAFCKAFSVVFEQGTGIIEKTIRKDQLEKDYEIQNYAIGIKGTRKELKQLRKKAGASGVRDMAVTAAEGIGLGVLGIGLPDIVVFTGFILRGIYETALQYGFTYDATEEKLLILKMMEASLSHGEEWVRVNAEVDRILAKEWHGNHAEDDVTQQIRRTADVFALDMLLAKFIQGLPLIGIVGGAGNPVYYGKVIRYAQLKYHKRYLQEKLDKINKELK